MQRYEPLAGATESTEGEYYLRDDVDAALAEKEQEYQSLDQANEAQIKDLQEDLAAQQHRDLQLLGERDEKIRHLENELAEAKAEVERLNNRADTVCERTLIAFERYEKQSDEKDTEIATLRKKLEEAIKLYDEYLSFLAAENNGPITLAFAHGWRCPDDVAKKGEDYRKRIEALKEAK